MDFSIITPSFRNSAWLRLCVASVADQQGVSHEHIIQDAGSDDGTQDWLPRDPRVKAFIEKDAGMYDAINRGLRRASGEIVAHLNSDEQYLPGALAAVAEAFARNPDTDILLADTVIVDAQGQFICCRKSLVALPLFVWAFRPAITASIFYRRRVLDDFNLYYDARWRGVGDVFWFRDALSVRAKMRVLRRYTSVFAETGGNLSLKPEFLREKRLLDRMVPAWARWFRWPLLQAHRCRALAHGLYSQRPFSFALYTPAKPAVRVEVAVAQPTCIWWQRHPVAKGT
jgi:glycosyltransferase involved in cell wall biosynthesis